MIDSHKRLEERIVITDASIFDRSAAISKLDTDLCTSTSHAEQHGITITTIIRHLLEMAEWWCGVANNRNVDLSELQGWQEHLGGKQ